MGKARRRARAVERNVLAAERHDDLARSGDRYRTDYAGLDPLVAAHRIGMRKEECTGPLFDRVVALTLKRRVVSPEPLPLSDDEILQVVAALATAVGPISAARMLGVAS